MRALLRPPVVLKPRRPQAAMMMRRSLPRLLVAPPRRALPDLSETAYFTTKYALLFVFLWSGLNYLHYRALAREKRDDDDK
jgi:hypothetical protein